MKLWIDDVRQPPDESWTWVKSVDEAKIYYTQCTRPYHNVYVTPAITEISLDHDAGDYASMGGDYIRFLDWLEKKAIIKNYQIDTLFTIHSRNPVGKCNMENIIRKNYWRYM